MKKKTKKQWLWEFTKRLVIAVTIIFVIAIIFAEVVIWQYPDSSAIGTFVECMCDVFKVTVVAATSKKLSKNFLIFFEFRFFKYKIRFART